MISMNAHIFHFILKRKSDKFMCLQKSQKEEGFPSIFPLTSPQASRAPAHLPQNTAASPRLSASQSILLMPRSRDALQSARESRTAQQALPVTLCSAAPGIWCFREGLDLVSCLVSCCSHLIVNGCCIWGVNLKNAPHLRGRNAPSRTAEPCSWLTAKATRTAEPCSGFEPKGSRPSPPSGWE